LETGRVFLCPFPIYLHENRRLYAILAEYEDVLKRPKFKFEKRAVSLKSFSEKRRYGT